MPINAESRILIHAPFGKDSTHLSLVLGGENIPCQICRDIYELAAEFKMGAAGILTTEEVLLAKDTSVLIEALEAQPTWSSIPVIAFYNESSAVHSAYRKDQSRLQPFAEVTFLQRPIAMAALLSAVRASIRDRRRQYTIRDLLEKLEAHAKEQQNARELADKAKTDALHATQMKSQFLANMSHEIRTPLGAIMGFLELIRNGTESKEEIENYISVVTRNSVQLMRLIDDILDISKVEAGKMEFEYVDFSLGELLFDFAALMSFKAREKGIVFDINLMTSVPAKVISDPTRIRQILTNAVGNAIKFTERGNVQLACAYVGSELTFQITDTGRGITQEQTETLFQPFSQADSSTTRKYGGTGLGLVLTRHICRQMGGDFILKKSSLGVGSTFVATVIAKSAQNTRMLGKSDLGVVNDKAKAATVNLAGMRVLLADDSSDNRALFNIMLGKLGAVVDLAEDGRAAVELAKNASYDVVLMDVQMPYMDGHEATKYLRKNGYQKPIIALTAHAMKEERERASASGFTDFLSKPLQFDTLANTLRFYFEQRSHHGF